MWLELCGQVQLAAAAAASAASASLGPVLQDRDLLTDCENMIDRYLRLATVKGQTTEMLTKLRLFHHVLPRAPVVDALLPAPGMCRSSPALLPLSPTCPRSPTLENPKPADQLTHPALQLIAARPDIFCRQGYIAATYRHCNSRTFGPYYQLAYRQDGRLCSVYLGRAGELVEKVRQALAALQGPRVQSRLLSGVERQIRAALRIEKLHLAGLLRPFGFPSKVLRSAVGASRRSAACCPSADGDSRGPPPAPHPCAVVHRIPRRPPHPIPSPRDGFVAM